ncbi:ACP S-malonyltransferase [Elusimicrobiota bacterium]
MSKAFIFPGQGAQQMGMGKEFYEEGNWVNDIWDEANSLVGYDLKTKVFNGPEEDLKQTEVTQPAMYMTEIIIHKALLDSGIKPDITAGHSLGEYTAVVASGALSWQQGLELVKFRGETFSAAASKTPGGMIAVIGMEEDKLAEILNDIDGVAEIVNYNSPGQLVVSVQKNLLEEASLKIKEGGAKLVIPLKVSVGFHSSLLDEAVVPMSEKINSMEFKTPEIAFYSNCTGEKIETSEGIKDCLIKQVNSPVKWVSIINNIAKEHPASEFIEVGPGKVLQGLLKKIDRALVGKGVSTPEDISSMTAES